MKNIFLTLVSPLLYVVYSLPVVEKKCFCFDVNKVKRWDFVVDEEKTID